MQVSQEFVPIEAYDIHFVVLLLAKVQIIVQMRTSNLRHKPDLLIEFLLEANYHLTRFLEFSKRVFTFALLATVVVQNRLQSLCRLNDFLEPRHIC